MLTYAVLAFAAAAVLGLVLAGSVLRARLAPWSVSLLHAGLGAVGLILAGLAVLNGTGGSVTIAWVILLVAALGGFYLAFLHFRQQLAPRGVVMIHAGAAVAGFAILAGTAFGMF